METENANKIDAKRMILAIVIFSFVIVWSCFAIYGIVQTYKKPAHTELLEAWKDRTVALELEIEEYERITKALPVLRQLINPKGWLEIEALAERNRQEKIGNAKRGIGHGN
jgi:hypothetical protein